MIPNQRALFDIPDDIAYLNCAFTSPLLKSARAAADAALDRKAHPWQLSAPDFIASMETNRTLFAQLANCMPDDVAIVPAASYGVATAARNLSPLPGERILVLAEQFPSHVYSWRNLAARTGAVVETIPRQEDQDWTRAILEAFENGPRVAIAALPPSHWTDGTRVDLVAVGQRCRESGTALVIDATQAMGASIVDLAAIQPDFLVTASHKWLLGAYGYGFLYVAPHRQEGEPLEENYLSRAGSEDFSRLVDYQDAYQPGARRFDMGEASMFQLAPVAAAGITQILDWTLPAVVDTLAALTGRIADRAQSLGLAVAPKSARAPHMLGLGLPAGKDTAALLSALAAHKVYVSIRGASVRVAPHLYTTDQDIVTFFGVLERFLG
ncbi:aminotransferase class V-fold PLP-dependent enzyme [Oceanidesulfovibrio marinus]|uniref:Aminotransferase n=1 Tax=Oceanidesulfovibrio marinus TaxID=370038 RepID=A0A6P1ZEN7_9BACT|nr:aminotransferase class V-fold PLP-dependent enzyme [Oceanidesulfovibrio marinus]TVM33104.1 aminotransferase [Oceanidesulfovibrio marinus]